MSDINDFIKAAAQGGGNAMSFPRIKDYLAGRTVDRELVDDQHNPGKRVLKIKIAVESAMVDGQALDLGDDQVVKMDVPIAAEPRLPAFSR